MNEETKEEKKRRKEKERYARMHPYLCRGKDQYHCNKSVKEKGKFCGPCKAKFAFQMRMERKKTIPIEDRRAFYQGIYKTRAEARTYEKAYKLNDIKYSAPQ